MEMPLMPGGERMQILEKKLQSGDLLTIREGIRPSGRVMNFDKQEAFFGNLHAFHFE
ncbi:MAG: hypothetical protein HQL63_15445 [Magnetococcales bacterium]|nr:hypothetical protein [Magnetococcales bacterium]MBF0322313.1 hypothetical protein [Magnetococcales bacterium]